MSFFPAAIPWDMVTGLTRMALARQFNKEFFVKLVYLVGCMLQVYLPDPSPEPTPTPEPYPPKTRGATPVSKDEQALEQILSQLPLPSEKLAAQPLGNGPNFMTILEIARLIISILATKK